MRKIIFFAFILGLALASFNFVQAQSVPVVIDFFYSATCPHCAAEKEFLKNLQAKYPEVQIKSYEVISSAENQALLKDFYQKYHVPKREQGFVPVTFTPTKYFIGFNDQVSQGIENCLKECIGAGGTVSQEIKLPFFGQVDTSKISLPVLTVIFGALDGFNPCAMWILLFLIALLINTRSRKRMWLVAGTFVLVSGIFYFLVLAAWLNLFLAIPYVNLTRTLVGILAVTVGLWQIKNFLTYHPNVCQAIGLKARLENGLRNKAERVVSSPLTWAMLGGVVLLALGVNLIEFFCSAGLPAIYTRTLALSGLSSFAYYLYLLLYTIIFILDDLIIFSLAVITLSKLSFTEKYNYWTALIGGLLIFILGVLLIFKPSLLIFN